MKLKYNTVYIMSFRLFKTANAGRRRYPPTPANTGRNENVMQSGSSF